MDNIDGDLTGQLVVCGVSSVLLDAPTLPTTPFVVSYQVRGQTALQCAPQLVATAAKEVFSMEPIISCLAE
jgi:hypothetical protein